MSGNDTLFNFEKSLEELNKIVAQMEQGGLSLEDSLRYFERGIALTRDCQSVLNTAEQQVQILLQKNSELVLSDYETEE